MIPAMSNYDSIIDKYILIEGPIAVFGVFNGQGCVDLYNRYNRIVYAFDTFEGLPKEDYIDKLDYDNQPGKFKPEHDAYQYLMDKLPNIIPIKGRYVDTLNRIPKGLKFSLIYLDCDYYNSYKQVLEYLVINNNLDPDTLIISDDYRFLEGAKKAMNEWSGKSTLNQEIWMYYKDRL